MKLADPRGGSRPKAKKKTFIIWQLETSAINMLLIMQVIGGGGGISGSWPRHQQID
jgi:hypothetical protein